ncbi:Hypothetical predicted protein [Mytilus galloprovincialis]|uniref:Protein sleepless n=1 Tax=Mytilus galloprovincialis TaxID=29158 RepID=A0A8B6ELX1_MYTGA|nr:Hypothetical predicted protein [Mytilus galloprovincialis]
MMCLIRSWIICVFCFGLILYSDALWCYQCGDSSIEAPCVTDTAGMEAEYIRRNDSLKNPKPDEDEAPYKYLKDCLNTSDICIIERIEEQGQTHAYIRDCHTTGKSYSIQDLRFNDLDSSLNHTTCIYERGSSKRLVCVTICDTDFCNGPQIDGGSILQIQIWLNVLCAAVVILRQI